MKKMLLGALSVIMALGCAVGCGNTGNNSQGGNTHESNRPSESASVPSGVTNPFILNVFNFNGGYGSQWLAALEKRYEAEKAGKTFTIDGKTYDGVDIKIDAVKKVMKEMSNNYNFATNHVYFQEDVWYTTYLRNGNIFEDMTEALTSDNPYEPGVTLESKLSEEQKQYFNINGKYYGVPHYAGYVGINYDIDLFEEKEYYLKDGYKYDGNTEKLAACFTADKNKMTAGPDGKKGTDDDGLPTTYDEFFMLCGYIKQNNDTPITWDNKNRQKYLNWFLSSLAASYEGLEQTNLNYTFSGTAKNLVSVAADGTVTRLPETEITSENGYELARQAGRYYGLDFIETLADNEYYYSPSGYSNTDAQDKFIQGIGDNYVAMLVDGVWWENEADATFTGEELIGEKPRKDRKYGFMPLPAATKEKADERKSALGQNKAGYTLLDTHSSLCFIGKGLSEDIRKLAIDFIQFAYTDKSLTEFTTITDTTKALKYTVSEADKANMSAYGRSIITMQEKSDVVYSFSRASFFQNNETTLADFDNAFMSTVDKTTVAIPIDSFAGGKSAKEYFDGLYIYRKDILWDKLAK